jgi:hypothetical protein
MKWGMTAFIQTKIKSKPFCKKLDSLPFLAEKVWIFY